MLSWPVGMAERGRRHNTPTSVHPTQERSTPARKTSQIWRLPWRRPPVDDVGIGFAIPSDTVKNVADRLIASSN